MPEYRFNELEYFKELKQYIDKTYGEHYQKGIPVVDFIMSHLQTPDFLRGNCLKYLTRYGYKNGYERKDLLKTIHYLFFMLYFHDQKWGKDPTNVVSNLNTNPYYDEEYEGEKVDS